MTKSCLALLSTVAVILLGACGAPRYAARFNEAESPILSGDCPVRVFAQSPDDPFVIVGEVAPEDSTKLATDEAAFVGGLRERICKHGGNAVIAIRDEQGRISSGTVIRIK